MIHLRVSVGAWLNHYPALARERALQVEGRLQIIELASSLHQVYATQSSVYRCRDYLPAEAPTIGLAKSIAVPAAVNFDRIATISFKLDLEYIYYRQKA